MDFYTNFSINIEINFQPITPRLYKRTIGLVAIYSQENKKGEIRNMLAFEMLPNVT